MGSGWAALQPTAIRIAIHPRFDGRSLLGIPLLRPTSLFVGLWGLLVLLLDLSYTAFLIPIEVAFDLHSAITWMRIVDVCAGAVILVDVVVTLHSGLILQSGIRLKLVMDGWVVS